MNLTRDDRDTQSFIPLRSDTPARAFANTPIRSICSEMFCRLVEDKYACYLIRHGPTALPEIPLYFVIPIAVRSCAKPIKRVGINGSVQARVAGNQTTAVLFFSREAA